MIKTGIVIEDCKITSKWFRQSLKKTYRGIEVISCFTYQEASFYLSNHSIDIALVDINLPDGSGIDLIQPLLKKSPDSYIIIMTMLDDDYHIISAIQRGAKGYLLKGLKEDDFLKKLKAISEGDPPLSPKVAQRILSYMQQPSILKKPAHLSSDKKEMLTKREKEVLTIIGKGYNRKETSLILSISDSTIATHIRNIYRKLNISNRSEATVEAYKLGFINII